MTLDVDTKNNTIYTGSAKEKMVYIHWTTSSNQPTVSSIRIKHAKGISDIVCRDDHQYLALACWDGL
jgi:hypothetical protein